jgi:hypothetical protein
MSYVTHVKTDGTVGVSGQDISWTIDELGAGDDEQLTIAVTVDAEGTFVNTVTSEGATSANATVLVLENAVTNFRMDETAYSWVGTSGEVVDSGGTELHGLFNGTSKLSPVDPPSAIADEYPSVSGGFCNAAYFDGDSVIEVADSSAFDYTTQLSATAWIYPTAYNSEFSSILSNDVNYEFHLNSSGRLYWWWQSSNLTSSTIIPKNEWTHVAITFNSASGEGSQQIYINGELDSNSKSWEGTLSTNNCPVHIGGDVGTSSSCPIMSARNFKGMIDEVKLYGFKMSQEQVQADMTMGRTCSGLFDHIRILHDGSGSICSTEKVTIKACMNSDCSSLYPGAVTVILSPTGWVDGDTFTFTGGITSEELSWGTAGDITLGTTSVSPTPAEDTTCYNGGDETCVMTFTEDSCAFDVVECGASAQTSLYTKLAGVAFDVDVLALTDSTTINTDYVSDVSVDLVDASSSNCPTGEGLASAQDLTFSLSDSGRKTVSLSYSGAAANVKVRVQNELLSLSSCSSDNFAIRPQFFTISSDDADNHSTAGSPIITTGDSFTLSAESVSGYDGTPDMDTDLVVGSPEAGTLSGSFSEVSSSAGTTDGSFTYSEVGHFGLEEYAVYDEDFTAVDQPGDCTSDYSNTLTGGLYGCYFGSEEVPVTNGSSGFGRFVPSRFSVSANTPMFANSCDSTFTYLGQSFDYLVGPALTVSAVNSSGDVTQNYEGDYWNLTSSLEHRGYSNNATTAATLEVSTEGDVTWSDVAIADGQAIATLTGEELTYVKPVAAEVPFTTDITLNFTAGDLTDTDGVCYDPDAGGICEPFSIISILGGEQRYGRMRIQNVYGPETLDLDVSILTEYYSDGGYVQNADDSCTALDSMSLGLSDYTGKLVDVGTSVLSGTGSLALSSGWSTDFSLLAPGSGNDGSVTMTYDLSSSGSDMTWLQYDWDGDGVVDSPTGKATFGIYQGNPHLIYMRESIW